MKKGGNSDSIDANRGDPGSLDNIEYDVDEKIQHAEENIEPLNEIERKSPAASVPDSTDASSPTAGDGTEYSTALDTNLCCNCSEELEMTGLSPRHPPGHPLLEKDSGY